MPRPDEGLIHSWLDDELDGAESARVEALVRNDPEWAAAAAEARGLIAASTRITGMLDDVPANVIPIHPAIKRGAPWWAKGIAALVVVTAGSVLVWQRMASEGEVSAPVVAVAPPVTAPVAVPRIEAAPQASIATEKRTIAAKPAAPPVREAPALTPPPAVASVSAPAPAPAPALAAKKLEAQSSIELKDARRIDAPSRTAAGAMAAPSADVAAKASSRPVTECYREPQDLTGAEAVLHAVTRLNDTTATDGNSRLRVHGDTLFVRHTNGIARVAIRIHCPA